MPFQRTSPIFLSRRHLRVSERRAGLLLDGFCLVPDGRKNQDL